MPQILDTLRVSAPEVIYAKLERPASPDLQLALDGLAQMFEVRQTVGLHPSFARQAWMDICDAMVEDPSGLILPATRPVPETSKRVLGVVLEFPWLRVLDDPAASPEQPMWEREFYDLFLGHTVDDYPGLFGVTLKEAKMLRARSHEGIRRNNMTEFAIEAGLYDQPAYK